MSNEETLRVMCYSPDDGRVHIYKFSDQEAQQTAEIFHRDIWFTMTDEEFSEFYSEPEKPKDNLKNDFIYYTATINGTSFWTCTCGNFLETDAKGVDRMLKRVVSHARKSGHTINPRGN